MTTIIPYQTVLTGKRGNTVAFEGEKFFPTSVVVNLEGKKPKHLLHTIAFNGVYVFPGVTTLLMTEDEIDEHFETMNMTLDAYEQRLLLKDEEAETEEDTKAPLSLEDLGIDLEALSSHWKDVVAQVEEESKEKVAMSLWNTILVANETTDVWKQGSRFVLSQFAKQPKEKDLTYILFQLEAVTHPVSGEQVFNTESIALYENKQPVILQHFSIVEDVTYMSLQSDLRKAETE